MLAIFFVAFAVEANEIALLELEAMDQPKFDKTALSSVTEPWAKASRVQVEFREAAPVARLRAG